MRPEEKGSGDFNLARSFSVLIKGETLSIAGAMSGNLTRLHPRASALTLYTSHINEGVSKPNLYAPPFGVLTMAIKANAQPVIGVAAVVTQKIWCVEVVYNKHVKVTVPIIIENQ